jgi:hypothetical protein
LHDDAVPLLYRVNGKLVKRVHSSVEALTGESAYILVDYAAR